MGVGRAKSVGMTAVQGGTRAQGYTSTAAFDDTMACRQSKTPPGGPVDRRGPVVPTIASEVREVGTTSQTRSDGRRKRKTSPLECG